MKVGIISDSHDNVENIVKAVEIFNSESVELVLHAGDYVAPFSVKPLFGLGCEFIGVFGNNDGDKIALQNTSKGKITTQFLEHSYEGKNILLGHYFETLDALVKSQEYHLIVYGHTHKPEIKRVGHCTVINPGECGGWLYGKATVAIADLRTGEAQIVPLPNGNTLTNKVGQGNGILE